MVVCHAGFNFTRAREVDNLGILLTMRTRFRMGGTASDRKRKDGGNEKQHLDLIAQHSRLDKMGWVEK